MAGAVEESEDLVIVILLCALLGVIVWALFQIPDLLEQLKKLFPTLVPDAGTLQSLKNVANGFPDGADPGTVPIAQTAQGIAESLRNYGPYQEPMTNPDEEDTIPIDAGDYPNGTDPNAYSLYSTENGVNANPLASWTQPSPDYDGTVDGNAIVNWLFQNKVF